MTRQTAIYVCNTTALPEEELTDELTYDRLKELVLEACQFSVFEATSSQHVAELFEQLCHDPEIETIQQGFPWTGVKRKGTS